MKNPIAVGITALQRPSKPLSDRYRIHVIDRAAQILDSFGFDHQELSVSEIGAKTQARIGQNMREISIS